MKTSHRESETGHTAAILEEIPVMFCNGLRCLLKLKIAGKTLITSQHVAGPFRGRQGSSYFLVAHLVVQLPLSGLHPPTPDTMTDVPLIQTAGQ